MDAPRWFTETPRAQFDWHVWQQTRCFAVTLNFIYLTVSEWLKSSKLIGRPHNKTRQLNGFVRKKTPRSQYNNGHWLLAARLFTFVFPVVIHDSLIAFPTHLLSLCYIVYSSLRDQGEVLQRASPRLSRPRATAPAHGTQNSGLDTTLQTNNPRTGKHGTDKSICPLDNNNRLRTKRRRGDRVRTTAIAITPCTPRKTCTGPWHQKEKGIIIVKKKKNTTECKT